jgi:hypothetical protein
MASAQSFKVNDNPLIKDTRAIDTYIEPHIFINKLIKQQRELEKGMTIIDIDSRYNFRPDRLAFELYGQDFWYPAILVINNLGSLLQFKAEILNFKCKIPSMEAIKRVLSITDIEHITIDSIVNDMYNN